MLGSTLVLTIDGVAVTLVKVNQDNYSSEYLKKDSIGQYRARIRHTKVPAKGDKAATDRHNFEFVYTEFATDTAKEWSRKFYYVLEHEPKDLDTTMANAVCDLAIATSDQFLQDLLQWQS